MSRRLHTATAAVETPDELRPTPLRLIGLDNGAGAIIAAVTDALRAAGNQRSVIDAWRLEALSGDYDHLLRAAMTYTYDPTEDDS